MAKMRDMKLEADETYLFGEFKVEFDALKPFQVLVLVESHTNKHLFKTFFEKKTCRFFSTNGFEGVISILKKHKISHEKAALGIIDADFRRITQDIPTLINLFPIDYHDSEIMMAFSNAWEKLIDMYAQEDKLENFEKRQNQDIRISVLRFLNHTHNLGFIFKTKTKKNGFEYIDYEEFTDLNTLKIDLKKLLKTIENKSQKQGFFEKEPHLKEELEKLLQQGFDLRELTNGHDLMNILALALSRAIGSWASSQKINGSQLEKDLILAYHLSDFEKTNLYQDLQHWQTENSNFKLLKTLDI